MRRIFTFLKIVKQKIVHFFRPLLSKEELELKKKQEDYEYLISHGVETEFGNVTLYGKPIIHKAPNSTIKIGKAVLLISDSEYNEAGINHPVILATMKAGAEIIIGDGTGFSGTSVVAFNSIRIGNRTGFGVNCNIWDSDFHSINSTKRGIDADPKNAPNAPIIIGDDVWSAANVTILKGVTIGNNAVIGAMSLVNKDIPAKTFFGGVPARKIKEL